LVNYADSFQDLGLPVLLYIQHSLKNEYP
jgi:hypothetical protein